ncbi:CDP-alcohol phosphatidyltransferase family protein [Stappia indica]|uniref:CDP-alcohol phosphatidyltransferase family protein n=1 Tax=Stappia indica TaxID=538381 RepID=UPI000832CCF1|nr:CDP-alcohol phosphatidyltransferase family protein [Stappia indica]
MFDARLRPLIDPPLNAAGRRLAAAGVGADAVTLAGFACGIAAAFAICWHAPLLAALLILANRLADGLDGAVARARARTDRGGYLDIVLDFFFYGAIPFAFALADPAANALAASALLFSFYMNGASFLGFAIMAEKRGFSTSAQGAKSLYYLGGLAEGAETIAVFLAFCLFPAAFAPIAWAFAAVCAVSATARLVMVSRLL